MKVIINQDKEMRIVGYNESIGCNPLDISFYIAKSLNPKAPVQCVIEDETKKYHLLLTLKGENDNYIVYKVLDLLNMAFDSGEKNLYLIINYDKTDSESLFFQNFNRHSLYDFIKEVK